MVTSTAASATTTTTTVAVTNNNNNNNNSKRDAFIAVDVPVNNSILYDNNGALFNRRLAAKSNSVLSEGIFKIFAERKAAETRTLFSVACCDINNNNNNIIGNNNYPSFTIISGALSSSVSPSSLTEHGTSFHPCHIHPHNSSVVQGPVLGSLQFKEIQRLEDGGPSGLDHGAGREAGVGHIRLGLTPPPDRCGRGCQRRLQVSHFNNQFFKKASSFFSIQNYLPKTM